MEFWVSLSFTDASQWTRLAKAAEDLGYGGISISDHIFTPKEIKSSYPYSPDGKVFWAPEIHWPDNWVAIGAMAAVTSRIKFITSVYILPLRNAFVVAKAVGTAAFMSENRVILGVGVGWMQEEFHQLREDFHTRGKRCDEMIEVMRKLWQGGMVEHHGRFFDFGPLQMSPAPTKPVPVYVGGITESAIQRAARLGDGWMSAGTPRTLDDIRVLVDRFGRLRKEAGRAQLPFVIRVSTSAPQTPDTFKRLEEMGITNIAAAVWNPYAGAPATIDAKLEAMERFAESVIHKQQ